MSLSPVRQFSVLLLSGMLALSACSETEDNDLANHATADDETVQLEGQVGELTPDEVSADATGGQKLNLNTATKEEFAALPNVGEKMAHEFEEYRPYSSIQQFRKAISKYTDEASIAAYEQHVFVPIDPNESDAATIQQIPGIDEDEAAEIIAGRPYADRAAFLEKLASYADLDASLVVHYLNAE